MGGRERGREGGWEVKEEMEDEGAREALFQKGCKGYQRLVCEASLWFVYSFRV